MGIQLSNIHGTSADAASGLTAVRDYLVEKYLQSPEYGTILANTNYASKKNLPRRKGQYMTFTIRNRMRLPENGVELADPASPATLSYSQLQVPIEWIKEYTDISLESRETSWLDLSNDINEEMKLALSRRLHYDLQHAFWVGRYKPGKRNSSGVTVGDASYPHFFTTEESTVSMYGTSFTFKKAPKYFGGGKASFDLMAADDYITMAQLSSIKNRIMNARAPRINGGLVAVISESMKHDLMRDSDFREAVLSFEKGGKPILEGQITTYDGITFVVDDEPMTLASGGDGIARANEFEGDVHVGMMFGMDSFGYVRLGGQNAERPNITVKDLSKTGTILSIGYAVPCQAMILRPEWCATFAAPVRIPDANG